MTAGPPKFSPTVDCLGPETMSEWNEGVNDFEQH